LFSIEVSSYEITGNANLTAQQNNVSLTVFNFTGSGAISVDCLAVNKRALVQLNFSFLLFNYVEMPAALSHVHTMYSLSRVQVFFLKSGNLEASGFSAGFSSGHDLWSDFRILKKCLPTVVFFTLVNCKLPSANLVKIDCALYVSPTSQSVPH